MEDLFLCAMVGLVDTTLSRGFAGRVTLLFLLEVFVARKGFVAVEGFVTMKGFLEVGGFVAMNGFVGLTGLTGVGVFPFTGPPPLARFAHVFPQYGCTTIPSLYLGLVLQYLGGTKSFSNFPESD